MKYLVALFFTSAIKKNIIFSGWVVEYWKELNEIIQATLTRFQLQSLKVIEDVLELLIFMHSHV